MPSKTAQVENRPANNPTSAAPKKTPNQMYSMHLFGRQRIFEGRINPSDNVSGAARGFGGKLFNFFVFCNLYKFWLFATDMETFRIRQVFTRLSVC